jgi:transcriptional regulator with XRE-family HTH domain
MMCFTLLKARRESRLTQRELADKAGLGVSTIARLEGGTFGPHGPDLSSLRAIAAALGRSVEDVFPELLAHEKAS